MLKLNKYALERDGLMLPLDIFAKSIEELPFLLLEMGIDGEVDILEFVGAYDWDNDGEMIPEIDN